MSHLAAGKRGGIDLILLGAAVLGLLAIGSAGAAGWMLRRRGPGSPPLTAAAAGPIAEPPGEVGALLDGLDLDAELRALLAETEGREREKAAAGS